MVCLFGKQTVCGWFLPLFIPSFEYNFDWASIVEEMYLLHLINGNYIIDFRVQPTTAGVMSRELWLPVGLLRF